MKVSVIIPTYNRKEVLELVLKSLANQTYNTKKYEVIVVDDGGNDGTDNMVKQLAKKVPYRLRYYWQERKGIRAGHARNLGLKYTEGKLIIFLDSDIAVVPEFIQEHVKSHKKYFKSVILGYSSGHGIRKSHPIKEIKKSIKEEELSKVKIIPEIREKYYQAAAKKKRIKNVWQFFYSNNASIKKEFLERLDGFDENMPSGWGFEDTELGYRLQQLGLNFYLNRKALGYVINEGTEPDCPFLSHSREKFEGSIRKMLYSYNKHKSKEYKQYVKYNIWTIPEKERVIILKVGSKSNTNGRYETIFNEKIKDKSTKEILEEINYLAKIAEPFRKDLKILLSGGEPTIRKDFFEITEYIKKVGFEIILETNGRLFYYKDFTEKVIKAGIKYFVVTIWAHCSLLHDFLTRTKGSFRQTMLGINNLLHYNVNVEIKIPIVHQNYIFLDKIEKIISKQGIKKLRFLDKGLINTKKLFPVLKKIHVKNKFFCIEALTTKKYSTKEKHLSKELNIAMVLNPAIKFNEKVLGGAEIVALELTKLLNKNKLKTTLFARGDKSNNKFMKLINLRTNLSNFTGDLEFIKSLELNIEYFNKILDESKEYNFLYGHNIPLLSIFSNKETFIHIHNPVNIPFYKELQEGYNKAYYLFNSNYTKNNFLKKYPSLNKERCFVIYNGVSVNKFKSPPTKSVKKKKIRLLYTGLWSEFKGIFILLDAIKILEKRRNDFELWLVGSPYLWSYGKKLEYQIETEKKIIEKVEKLKSVKIIGPIQYKNMPKIYYQCDILIVPSIWQEPFGLVIIEAMACGIPVIASNVGGVPEIISHKKNGILVESNNSSKLANEMGWLIDNKKGREELRKNALKVVKKKFNMEKLVKEYFKLLKNVKRDCEKRRKDIHIIGVNVSHHPSACLLKDGKIVVAIAEERLNRIKYSFYPDEEGYYGRNLPVKAIGYCMNLFKLKIEDIDYFIISGVTVNRNAKDEYHSRNLTKEDIKKNDLLKEVPENKIVILNHHFSHACSTFFPSEFDKSLILVIDGGGNYINERNYLSERTSIYFGYDKKIKLYKKIINSKGVCPNYRSNSLGEAYSTITRFIGFNEFDEGKTMGLSSYGNGEFYDFFIRNIQLNKEGYSVNPILTYDVFKNSVNPRLITKLGRIRKSGQKIRKLDKDLAFSVQKRLEDIIICLGKNFSRKLKTRNLCYAGGVALNSVVNYKLLKKTQLENIFIQPAASDDGCAIGNALYGWCVLMNKPRKWVMKHAYLGREYSNEEVQTALEKYKDKIKFKKISYEEIVKKTAKLISEGNIVGWFQGGSEFGPRALGHRSILADPRKSETKDILNEKVKHRESFRPYAPSVLLEDCREYFNLDVPSPFMLLVAKVHKDKRKIIPAVTHIDGTSRIQTVTKEDNGIYYDLIKEFKRMTGVPVLLNTSFNVAGEPIVETPEEALNDFVNTGMDYLVISNILINKLSTVT